MRRYLTQLPTRQQHHEIAQRPDVDEILMLRHATLVPYSHGVPTVSIRILLKAFPFVPLIETLC